MAQNRRARRALNEQELEEVFLSYTHRERETSLFATSQL